MMLASVWDLTLSFFPQGMRVLYPTASALKGGQGSSPISLKLAKSLDFD
jgi:hypothetical protein